jgi:hypothetical protein
MNELTRDTRDLEVELDAELRLERRADGQIWAATGAEAIAVRVVRCFPWSEPKRFISLRDFDDEEVALVGELDELDPASRKTLEEGMVEAGFVLQVQQILDIEEEIEIRMWVVRTAQGPRTFQTPRDEWPREVPGGGLLIRDVAGDLYHIAEPAKLDADSQRHLWAFVD